MSGQEGLDLTQLKQPSLIVLDRMLPDLGGEEVCADVRRRSDVPILMLTAVGSAEDRVAGFSLGADDYLVKPYSPRELVARIKALLKRSGNSESPLGRAMRFDGGALEIDTSRQNLTMLFSRSRSISASVLASRRRSSCFCADISAAASLTSSAPIR